MIKVVKDLRLWRGQMARCWVGSNGLPTAATLTHSSILTIWNPGLNARRHTTPMATSSATSTTTTLPNFGAIPAASAMPSCGSSIPRRSRRSRPRWSAAGTRATRSTIPRRARSPTRPMRNSPRSTSSTPAPTRSTSTAPIRASTSCLARKRERLRCVRLRLLGRLELRQRRRLRDSELRRLEL